jgi:L-threonylcarbamoyladenylate synthase
LNGDVVAIPTETVYGLAASINSEAGLQRIFSLKERPFFDPLIVHVASVAEAQTVVREWPPLAEFLANLFWPGPLTFVLPKATHINPIITSGLDTVAVRFPSHPTARTLIEMVGAPLAAPSANKFGRTSPSRAEHVRNEFPGVDLIVLDGGPSEVGVESTVLTLERIGSIDEYNLVRILRPGGITTEMLQNALKKWPQKITIEHRASEESPGHLKHHYMPAVPLVIIEQATIMPHEVRELSSAAKDLILSQLNTQTSDPETDDDKIGSDIDRPKLKKITHPQQLLLSNNATLAARELYSEMRRLSETGADLLYVWRSSGGDNTLNTNLWQALWDRLDRAASLVVKLD